MENMEKKDAGLPAGKKKRKIPWSMLYILATVVAVLLFGLFNQQFGNVFHHHFQPDSRVSLPGRAHQPGLLPL